DASRRTAKPSLPDRWARRWRLQGSRSSAGTLTHCWCRYRRVVPLSDVGATECRSCSCGEQALRHSASSRTRGERTISANSISDRGGRTWRGACAHDTPGMPTRSSFSMTSSPLEQRSMKVQEPCDTRDSACVERLLWHRPHAAWNSEENHGEWLVTSRGTGTTVGGHKATTVRPWPGGPGQGGSNGNKHRWRRGGYHRSLPNRCRREDRPHPAACSESAAVGRQGDAPCLSRRSCS